MNLTRGTEEEIERPPGPPGLPVVGNAHQYARDPFGFVTESAREYGSVVRWRMAGEAFYQLNNPDDIERVLVHDNGKYEKGERFQQQLGPVLGSGLLNSEGEFWRRQRHLIQPAFDPERIAEYADLMTDYTNRALEEWRDGETRNVHSEMMELTLEIVATTLFGTELSDRTEAVGEALDVVMARSESVVADYLPGWLPTPGNRRFQLAVESLDRTVYDVIAERRRNPGDDVVSWLLDAEDESGAKMDVEQIRDQVTTLLLAGHETTALALTFTLSAGAVPRCRGTTRRGTRRGARRPPADDGGPVPT